MKPTIIIIGIVAVIGTFWWYQYSPGPQNTSTIEETTTIKQTGVIELLEGYKLYRNEEWGFEFQYPENWVFAENSFYNSSTQFNLITGPPVVNNQPHPILTPFLINIVIPEFAENFKRNMTAVNADKSDVSIDSIPGVQYEYTTEQSRISILLSHKDYWVIISTDKKYQDNFYQIISTFKFLD